MVKSTILTSQHPFFVTLRKSIKTIEIEESFDLIISRPFGLVFALLAEKLRLTPTQVTVVATLLGILGGGMLMYQGNLALIAVAAGLIMLSGILDSSDGQLARLTGQTSELGRIIDGVYGYFLFISMYIGAGWIWIGHYGTVFIGAAFGAIAFQAVRAMVYDFYKNEFMYWYADNQSAKHSQVSDIESRYQQLKPGVKKVLMKLYIGYTSQQSGILTRSQAVRNEFEALRTQNPDAFRAKFRKRYAPFLTLWALIGGDNIHRLLIIFFVLLGRFDYYIGVSIGMMGVCLICAMIHKRSDKTFIKELKNG